MAPCLEITISLWKNGAAPSRFLSDDVEIRVESGRFLGHASSVASEEPPHCAAEAGVPTSSFAREREPPSSIFQPPSSGRGQSRRRHFPMPKWKGTEQEGGRDSVPHSRSLCFSRRLAMNRTSSVVEGTCAALLLLLRLHFPSSQVTLRSHMAFWYSRSTISAGIFVRCLSPWRQGCWIDMEGR